MIEIAKAIVKLTTLVGIPGFVRCVPHGDGLMVELNWYIHHWSKEFIPMILFQSDHALKKLAMDSALQHAQKALKRPSLHLKQMVDECLASATKPAQLVVVKRYQDSQDEKHMDMHYLLTELQPRALMAYEMLQKPEHINMCHDSYMNSHNSRAINHVWPDLAKEAWDVAVAAASYVDVRDEHRKTASLFKLCVIATESTITRHKLSGVWHLSDPIVDNDKDTDTGAVVDVSRKRKRS